MCFQYLGHLGSLTCSHPGIGDFSCHFEVRSYNILTKTGLEIYSFSHYINYNKLINFICQLIGYLS